jgi:MFS family permease
MDVPNMSSDIRKLQDGKDTQTKEKDIELLMGDDQETGATFVVPTPSAEITFPDGGYKAWLTVLGGWLSFIASIGFLSGFSVFQSYYSTTQLPTHSPDDISWIGGLQIWGCFFFGLWAGRLSDKYGPKVPLALGTFFMVFGTMMASISKTYYQFMLSQGLCSAVGFGFAFTPALRFNHNGSWKSVGSPLAWSCRARMWAVRVCNSICGEAFADFYFSFLKVSSGQ